MIHVHRKDGDASSSYSTNPSIGSKVHTTATETNTTNRSVSFQSKGNMIYHYQSQFVQGDYKRFAGERAHVAVFVSPH